METKKKKESLSVVINSPSGSLKPEFLKIVPAEEKVAEWRPQINFAVSTPGTFLGSLQTPGLSVLVYQMGVSLPCLL